MIEIEMSILKDHSNIWDISYIIVSKEDGEYPDGFYEYNYKSRYDRLQRYKRYRYFSGYINYLYDLYDFFKSK